MVIHALRLHHQYHLSSHKPCYFLTPLSNKEIPIAPARPEPIKPKKSVLFGLGLAVITSPSCKRNSNGSATGTLSSVNRNSLTLILSLPSVLSLIVIFSVGSNGGSLGLNFTMFGLFTSTMSAKSLD